MPGGLIPLVLAGLGDTYDMSERQVMIGRMLFAIISGQMLGSTVAGFANTAFGWRSGLAIAAFAALLATVLAWAGSAKGRSERPARCAETAYRVGEPYGRVLANPKAPWLIGGGGGRGDHLPRSVLVHGRS